MFMLKIKNLNVRQTSKINIYENLNKVLSKNTGQNLVDLAYDILYWWFGLKLVIDKMIENDSFGNLQIEFTWLTERSHLQIFLKFAALAIIC